MTAPILHDKLAQLRVAHLSTLVVLGSGMGSVFGMGELTPVATISTGITGHPGLLALLGNPNNGILLSLGRKHLYEGASRADIEATVRAAAACGARRLLLANAAGGLNPQFAVGDVMLLNNAFATPMTRLPNGVPSQCSFSSKRYPPMESALIRNGVAVRRGSYAMTTGPSYETRAEIRMLRRLGADAVGMSTLLEAAAGIECGMEVAGFSLITNIANETPTELLDHHHVVAQGQRSLAKVRRVVEGAIEVYAT